MNLSDTDHNVHRYEMLAHPALNYPTKRTAHPLNSIKSLRLEAKYSTPEKYTDT